MVVGNGCRLRMALGWSFFRVVLLLRAVLINFWPLQKLKNSHVLSSRILILEETHTVFIEMTFDCRSSKWLDQKSSK